MGRVASGWPWPVLESYLATFELGDCPSVDRARWLVAVGRARWVYGRTGVIRLVAPDYELRPGEREIAEAPWVEMPDNVGPAGPNEGP